MKIKIARPIVLHWEPISGAIHFIAAFVALFGLVQMNYHAARESSFLHFWTTAVFMCSMLTLYTASAVYHIVPLEDEFKPIFRSLDQTAIFALIAGTYTPICLIVLRNSNGVAWFVAMWTAALLASILAIPRLKIPKFIPALIGLTMGWAGAFKIPVLKVVLGFDGYAFFFWGGIAYTIGAVLYIIEYIRDPDGEGWYHEIFHLLVMAGSLCHFWLMLNYVLYL